MEQFPAKAEFPPNTWLNVVIAIFSFSLATGLLVFASRTDSWSVMLICAILFSFVNNTIFSLLHEAVHNAFSNNAAVNYIFGVLSAAFFPTGYTFQKTCHLGHHARNRTEHEMFDYYYPDDNRFLKFAQFYSIFTGIYWLTLPIGWLTYLIFPGAYKILSHWRRSSSTIAHTGAVMMEPFVAHPEAQRIRWEIVYTILFQTALFVLLGVTWQAWLLCYLCFGINWGALQYADHAWSVRDVRNGAWNLKVNKIVQYVFLNYHHHLAHHQYPYIPWIHLSKFVDFNAPRPAFLDIYFEMWKGPKPLAHKDEVIVDEKFTELIYES